MRSGDRVLESLHMRVGVYGGSFDPVHIGHLIVAECCREQARLDRVLLVPAAEPPHKQGWRLAEAQHRLAMLALAVGGQREFAISTAELDRGGVSYTCDTLASLAAAHPADELLLILGPDALAQFPRWHKPQQIIDKVELLAVERMGLDDIGTVASDSALAGLLGQKRLAHLLETRIRCPAIGVRSTDLRAAVAQGQSIRYRTPRAVEAYIASHRLYTAPPA